MDFLKRLFRPRADCYGRRQEVRKVMRLRFSAALGATLAVAGCGPQQEAMRLMDSGALTVAADPARQGGYRLSLLMLPDAGAHEMFDPDTEQGRRTLVVGALGERCADAAIEEESRLPLARSWALGRQEIVTLRVTCP